MGVGVGVAVTTGKLLTELSVVPAASLTISRMYFTSAFVNDIVILQPGVVPQTIEASAFSNDHVHVRGATPVDAVPSRTTF